MSSETDSAVMNARLKTILLCGPPGVGKTTLVKKICEKLRGSASISCRGFYTEEIRSDEGKGKRLGFDVVTLKGLRGVLAREALGIQNVDCPTVGNYRVFIREFETVALPPLVTCPRNNEELLVIDELGKMELKSKKFATTVKSLMNEVPLLATVPLKGGNTLPIVQEISYSPHTKIFRVTPQNRDSLVDEVIQSLKSIMS